jgi:hypothetical protein
MKMICKQIGKGTPGSVFTHVPVGLLQFFCALCRAEEVLYTRVVAVFAYVENCNHQVRVQLGTGALQHLEQNAAGTG